MAREIVDLISSDLDDDDDDEDDGLSWSIPVPNKRRKFGNGPLPSTTSTTTTITTTSILSTVSTKKKQVIDDIIFTSSPARIPEPFESKTGSGDISSSPSAVKIDFSSKTADILNQITTGNKPKAKKAKRSKVEIEDVSDDDSTAPKNKGKVDTAVPHTERQVKTAEREKLREDKAIEKEKAKQAREGVRAAKAVEKQRAADIAAVNRSKLDKKTTAPEMIVDFPTSMDGSSSLTQAREFLRTINSETTLYSSEIPGIIKFRRKIRAEFSEGEDCYMPVPHRVDDEKIIIIHMLAKDFAGLVSPSAPEQETIEQRINHIRRVYPDHRSILLIEGLDALLAKEKNASNRAYQAAVRRAAAEETAREQPSTESNTDTSSTVRKRQHKTNPMVIVDESAIEATLLSLQIKYSMQIHQCASTPATETGETIRALTEQISQSRYREPPVLTAAQLAVQPNFCMATGQVATGKDIEDTYLKILQQIIRITEREAVAIASVYPTVGSLFRAFRSDGDRILENIKKEGGGARGNANGTAAERRIGISASQRLARIFLTYDPEELVG